MKWISFTWILLFDVLLIVDKSRFGEKMVSIHAVLIYSSVLVNENEKKNNFKLHFDFL